MTKIKRPCREARGISEVQAVLSCHLRSIKNIIQFEYLLNSICRLVQSYHLLSKFLLLSLLILQVDEDDGGDIAADAAEDEDQAAQHPDIHVGDVGDRGEGGANLDDITEEIIDDNEEPTEANIAVITNSVDIPIPSLGPALPLGTDRDSQAVI